jgi:hypothetical protein
MAVAKASEHEVDSLVESGTLSVAGIYAWKIGDNKHWIKVVIPVKTNAKNLSLRICITVNSQDDSRRNFTLLWNNCIRVRALCMEGSHSNKHTNAERWLSRTHKHKWTDKCQDRFAYTPTDLTASDVQSQLEQFCAECGIDCSATLASIPPLQKDLYDDL